MSDWGASTEGEDVPERETSMRLPAIGDGAPDTPGVRNDPDGTAVPTVLLGEGVPKALEEGDGDGCAEGEFEDVPAAPETSTWSLTPMLYCAVGRMETSVVVDRTDGVVPGDGNTLAGEVLPVVKAIVAGDDACAPDDVTSACGSNEMT